MTAINETGHATESFPNESTVPSATPNVVPDVVAAKSAVLMLAFDKYRKALSSMERAQSGLWEAFCNVQKMTKEEGEPILRDFLKAARKFGESDKGAVSTVGQYASRVRAGWKAGITPAEGEGANAFYKRAQDAIAAQEAAQKGGDDGDGEGGDVTGGVAPDNAQVARRTLMKALRDELGGMTNAQHEQVVIQLKKLNQANQLAKAA